MIGYQDRINRMVFYFKEVRAKRFHPSTFDILRFAVQSRLVHRSGRFDRNGGIDLRNLIRGTAFPVSDT